MDTDNTFLTTIDPDTFRELSDKAFGESCDALRSYCAHCATCIYPASTLASALQLKKEGC